MSIETYDGLKDAIVLWLNRDDEETAAQVPTFINMAEKQIYRNLRIPEMEGEREYHLREGDTFIYVPTDILELKQIYIIDKLETITDADGIVIQKGGSGREYRATRTSYDKLLDLPELSGDLCYFARHVERYYFKNLPSNDLKVRVSYYRDPQELINGTDTNYLLTVAPELLLFTALKFGSMFNKDIDAETMWERKAAEVFIQLQTQADQTEWSGSRKDQADINDLDLSFLNI